MNPAAEPKSETLSTAVGFSLLTLIQSWCEQHDRTLSWFVRDAILAKARALNLIPDQAA